MKKRLVKRIFCIFLAICILSSFALALTYGSDRQDSAVTLAPGAQWHEGVWDKSGKRVSENYIEYSPNAAVHPITAYGSKLYGTSTYKTAAAYVEQQGKNIAAVINGDFFNTSSGLPNGIVITDGIVRGSDGYQYAVGFKADGSVMIGKPSMAMSFSSASLSGSIAAVNRALSSAGVFLYTPDFSANTRSDLKAVYVIVRPFSANLTMQCSLSAVVEEVKLSSKAISIPEGCMILAATANNSNYSALSSMTPGESVTINISCAPGWSEVMWAVGAKELLVENGRAVSSLSNSAAPRTAVGIKADGTAIFYTVDGRQEDHSAGAGLSDLAKRLIELGCVSAVNLDGGGSTSMGIVIPGQQELTTVNSPSDGSLRKCANFIFLVNDSPAQGFAQSLHIYPASRAALAGAQVTFSSGATDANGHYAQTGTINYSSTAGSVAADGVWTAPGTAGSYTVTASAAGLAASATVDVVTSADKVSIYRSSTRVTDKKLTLTPGSVTDFSAKAWHLSRLLASDDNLFKWETSGNIGTVTSEGVFTATNIETGASGTLTLTSGSAKATVTINISGTCAVLEDFESEFLIEGEGAALENCSDLTKVRYGSSSGALSYTPAPDGASSSFVKVSMPLSDGLTWLCGWVKGDGSTGTLSAKLDGKDELLPLCSLTSNEWTFFAAELPTGAAAISELHITGTGKQSGRIWLDTFYQSKSDVCDTGAPTIDPDSTDPSRAVVLDGAQAIPSQNISVKYDLSPIDFTYNAVSGTLTMELPELAAGDHLLTVTAGDVYGNMNTRTVKLNGGATLDPFADTEGHWAKPMIAYLYEQGIVTGSTKNGSYLFRPDDKITRQEFAALVCRYMGVDTSLYADVVLPFEDNKDIDSWAIPYVKAMYALGISTGSLEYGHLIFAPEACLTRAQAMAMLGRTQPMGYASAELTFSDTKDIPSWALPFISPLALRGVINGSGGKLNPSSDVTRAEVAKMIYSMS